MPCYHSIGPFQIQRLIGGQLYIRHDSGEGGVFDLREFERVVYPWDCLHLCNQPEALTALVTSFYSKRF